MNINIKEAHKSKENKNNKKKKNEKHILIKKKKIIIIILLEIQVINYFINENFIIEKWIKYKLNPVLGYDINTIVFDPFVMLDENKLYRMYVSWRNVGKIALSFSSDGIKWSNLQIVLEKGNSSSWENIVNRASVIYKDGVYYMWYTGQSNGVSKIGYAISKDGLYFKKLDNPVLIPEYSYEKESVMNPHVIYDDKEKIYKMWYSAGESYEPDVIGYATSEDGINWIKYKNNPIFFKNRNKLSLDSFKIGGCDVHKMQDNTYLMFYIGYSDINTARIFVAKSKNGITNWKRNFNPIIEPTKNEFDNNACYKPSAIYDKKNNKWMLWYNGRKKEKEFIGLAIYNKYKIFNNS